MRVLVTGANGFVGQWLVARLQRDGHDVVAGIAGGREPEGALNVSFDLQDESSLSRLVDAGPYDGVVHLAGVSSGTDAARDVARAWDINATCTARLCEALTPVVAGDAVFLQVSTAEVYGAGVNGLRRETDPVAPCSPYAASKLGGEVAALEVHRRRGLRTVVARPFPHTGRGQDARFVVPAFVQRLLAAKARRAPAITVGNLSPVREFLHVSDVVDAYVRLLNDGEAGEVYNVASGQGVAIGDMLRRLMQLVGYEVITEVDGALMRAVDIPTLVGDATKIRTLAKWAPTMTLEDTLTEVVNAQAD